MPVTEVTDWEVVEKDNRAIHPVGPRGRDAGRISLSFQELQAAIARFNAAPVFGSMTMGTTRVTTTYTILVTDGVIFCNTDGAAFTATLPAGTQGRTFRVINSGSSGNDLTLAPDGSEHLFGANTNFTLFDGESLELTYDTTDGWY